MLAPIVTNLVSAVPAMAGLLIPARGLARHTTRTAGSFCGDLTLNTLHVLLLLALLLALAPTSP
jgi:K+-transporting ATPase A subunit